MTQCIGVSVSAPPLAAERSFKLKKKLQRDKCRMSIDECRIKEFFLVYFFKKEQSEATSTIRQLTFDIRHSLKFHTRIYHFNSLIRPGGKPINCAIAAPLGPLFPD